MTQIRKSPQITQITQIVQIMQIMQIGQIAQIRKMAQETALHQCDWLSLSA